MTGSSQPATSSRTGTTWCCASCTRRGTSRSSSRAPTAISRLNGALTELRSQVLLEGEDLGRQSLAPQLFQPRIARIALCIPFVGEAARGDVVDELAHRGRNVEMVEAADAGELPVLTRRRVVQRLGGAALQAHEPVGPLDLA